MPADRRHCNRDLINRLEKKLESSLLVLLAR
jgi:hypothetical protein